MNNNVGMSFKKLISNKNTVTILGVLLMVIVLYVGYTMRIRSMTDPTPIPYALENLAPRTKITSDQVGIVNVPKAALKGNIITDQRQIVGKYVNDQSRIPQGSMFYASSVVNKDQLKGVEALDYPEGHVLVNMSVTTQTTYGNLIYPGDYIDIYLRIQYSGGEGLTEEDSNKLTVGNLITNVKVLKVVDSNGNDVFNDIDNTGTPAQIIFAVPSEYHILLRKAMYLRTYDAMIIPVPTKVSTDEAPEATISSTELRDFINRVTAWTGDGTTSSGELTIPDANTQ